MAHQGFHTDITGWFPGQLINLFHFDRKVKKNYSVLLDLTLIKPTDAEETAFGHWKDIEPVKGMKRVNNNHTSVKKLIGKPANDTPKMLLAFVQHLGYFE